MQLFCFCTRTSKQFTISLLTALLFSSVKINYLNNDIAQKVMMLRIRQKLIWKKVLQKMMTIMRILPLSMQTVRLWLLVFSFENTRSSFWWVLSLRNVFFFCCQWVITFSLIILISSITWTNDYQVISF